MLSQTQIRNSIQVFIISSVLQGGKSAPEKIIMPDKLGDTDMRCRGFLCAMGLAGSCGDAGTDDFAKQNLTCVDRALIGFSEHTNFSK